MSRPFPDYDLLVRAKSGDQDAMNELILKYEPLIDSVTARYILPNADRDDKMQMGRIGFWRAIKRYDASKGITFVNFACNCVRGEVFRCLRDSKAKKRSAEVVSLEEEIEDSDGLILGDALPHPNTVDPESVVSERVDFELFLSEIKPYTTARDRQIMRLLSAGLSTADVGKVLGIKVNSVNSALYRVRKRLRRDFA